MIKSKTLNACCIALTIGAFGVTSTGCKPTDKSSLAKYDTANYTPNTDGSGFAGLWVLTYNNESTYIDGYMGYYDRELIRLTPVAGQPDTYDATVCYHTVQHHTVTASGNTILLPLDSLWPDTDHTFLMTSDGRMKATFESGGDWNTWRAVRLSSNPAADMGTLGIAFASDTAGTQNYPATCFYENQEQPFFDSTDEGYDLSSYYLYAAGKSDGGHAEIEVLKDATGPWVSGRDEANRLFDGSIDVDTLQSTAQGIEGEVTTQGYDQPGGAVVFDVQL